MQRRLELARDRLGGAARRRRRRPPGASTTTWPAVSSATLVERGDRARRRRARGALGGGEHAQRASRPRSGAKWCARTTITAAPSLEVDAELGARARRCRRGRSRWRCSTARRNASCAASEARSGARTRSTSEAISVVTSRSSAGGGLAPSGRAAAAGRRPRRRRAARACSTPARVGHQRALVGGRARGDGQHGARAVDQDQGRVERARRGAHDLGQARARLDGVGDRLERAEIERRRARRVADMRPDSRRGSPRLSSSSKYQRNAAAEQQPREHERGQHVEAQHDRHEPLPDARERRPRPGRGRARPRRSGETAAGRRRSRCRSRSRCSWLPARSL